MTTQADKTRMIAAVRGYTGKVAKRTFHRNGGFCVRGCIAREFGVDFSSGETHLSSTLVELEQRLGLFLDTLEDAPEREPYVILSNMNDTGVPWSEIADWLEENIPVDDVPLSEELEEWLKAQPSPVDA